MGNFSSYHSTGCTVNGNTSYKNGWNGIISGGANYDVITGNTVFDNCQVAQSNAYDNAGILDYSSYNLIADNIVYDDQGGGQTQVYGISDWLSGAQFGTLNSIVNNTVNTNKTAGIYLYSPCTETNVSGNEGYNPVGKITSPVGTTTIGIAGTGSTVTASTAYTVVGTNIFITAANSSNSNNSISIKDPAGNVLISGAATLTNQYVPNGYVINWGTFTGTAGAITVFGN